MERVLQWLDDVDDLCASLRHRLRWWPAARPARRAAPPRGGRPAGTRVAPLKTAR